MRAPKRSDDGKPDVDVIWSEIDDQRVRTVALLERLTDEQWDHPSLCACWTVRHVAAHLTLQAQHVGDIIGFIADHPRLLRSRTLNRTIHDSALLQAELPTDELVARIRGRIGSRRHNVFVTPRETLSDSLVHAQDIAIPLGIGMQMRSTAAVIVATRIGRPATPGSVRSSGNCQSTATVSPPRMRTGRSDPGRRSAGRSRRSCFCWPVASSPWNGSRAKAPRNCAARPSRPDGIRFDPSTSSAGVAIVRPSVLLTASPRSGRPAGRASRGGARGPHPR